VKTKVAFLFDKSNNWLVNYFNESKYQKFNLDVYKFYDANEIDGFDVVFILGYTKILSSDFLSQNSLNLVVHESDLPDGKGFAPIQWQLLQGNNEIIISLLEAHELVDSGDILLQSKISFDGTELYDDIRKKQAKATFSIIDDFMELYPNYERQKQIGDGSFYSKRRPKDGELNIDKSIRDNFNLLRIGNNDGWPSFFFYKGKKYIIKIFKGSE
jgi:methionyl-tRNA formyltransferase